MDLWKKESTSTDACYVDLLSECGNNNLQYEFMKFMYTNKNADKSTELRTRGNKQFKAKNWDEAMHLYNKSLCHAPNDSENISLAYANRSLCFFQMQKYGQCLVDIELAKKANYPKRLMHKLEEREAACLKLMIDEPIKSVEKVEPSLSFEADKRFPCLANVLEVRSDSDHNKHIMAKCDIDVGKIVMLEEMYITNVHSEKETFCKTCLKSAMNFVPCRNCSDIMFCDDSCMSLHKIHKMTCTALRGQKFDFIRIVELILMVVTEFPNAAALMEFTESALASHDFDTPKCKTEEQSKYRSFLKLEKLPDRLKEETDRVLSWSYQLLLEIPKVKRYFQSKREKQFLMHLIVQHQLIFISNAVLFQGLDIDTGAKQHEVSGLCIFESQLNHVCTPNASYHRCGTQIYVYTLRPVKKGDELYINSGKRPSGNQCKCARCVPKWKQADLKRIRLEQDYRDIMAYETNDFGDPEKRLIIKPKLENLMKKFGPLPWTPEFDAVSTLYDHCMRYEFVI